MNWKVVGTSCKLKSCKGVLGVQLARSEDSTVLTTETSQESSFANVILFLMFAFRLLRSFATWFGAEWPKFILQAGYFAVYVDSCKIEYARCPNFATAGILSVLSTQAILVLNAYMQPSLVSMFLSSVSS